MQEERSGPINCSTGVWQNTQITDRPQPCVDVNVNTLWVHMDAVCSFLRLHCSMEWAFLLPLGYRVSQNSVVAQLLMQVQSVSFTADLFHTDLPWKSHLFSFTPSHGMCVFVFFFPSHAERQKLSLSCRNHCIFQVASSPLSQIKCITAKQMP